MPDPLWSSAGMFLRWEELDAARQAGDTEKVAELEAILEETLERDRAYRAKVALDPNYGT